MKNNFKIFVINLDRSTTRLAHCQDLFNKAGLDFVRIAGVYGADLEPAELNRHYSASLNARHYHKQLNSGEIGCYLSHRKAWQTIIDDKLDFAIIVEDDINMTSSIHALIANLKQLSLDWDYIKLAEHNKRKRKVLWQRQIDQQQLVLFDKIPALTCAQAVSLQGAKKLLAHSEQFSRPVDIDIQHWWQKDLKVFGLTPFVFSPQELSLSEIDLQKKRKESSGKVLLKLILQLKFKLNNYNATRKRLIELNSANYQKIT